jgi:LmbE family N-acetylglucosaminyl deacetylase
VLRRERPDVVLTCDPHTLYTADDRLNHPDHRAAGQATLDAVYPAVRDHLNFIELWRDEGLEPHLVNEIWVAGTQEPNITLDVTAFWPIKIRALYEHASQIGDREKFTERMLNRHSPDTTRENPRYEEKFRRILLG